MLVDTERADDLDGAMEKLLTGDDAYRYSVAWIDCQSTGSRLGRSVLTRGDHARLEDLPERLRRAPDRARAFVPRTLARVPVTPPSGLLNPLTVGAFNEFWFRKAPVRQVAKPHHMTGFFHPLDGVEGWNRLYGRQGFLQYQFVVGDGHGETVRTVIERLSTLEAGQLPGRAEAVRARRSGTALLPHPRVDPGPRPAGRPSGAGPAARRPRPAGGGRRRTGVSGQGLAGLPDHLPGHVPPGRGVAGGAGPRRPRRSPAVRSRAASRAVHRCRGDGWRRRPGTRGPGPADVPLRVPSPQGGGPQGWGLEGCGLQDGDPQNTDVQVANPQGADLQGKDPQNADLQGAGGRGRPAGPARRQGLGGQDPSDRVRQARRPPRPGLPPADPPGPRPTAPTHHQNGQDHDRRRRATPVSARPRGVFGDRPSHRGQAGPRPLPDGGTGRPGGASPHRGGGPGQGRRGRRGRGGGLRRHRDRPARHLRRRCLRPVRRHGPGDRGGRRAGRSERRRTRSRGGRRGPGHQLLGAGVSRAGRDRPAPPSGPRPPGGAVVRGRRAGAPAPTSSTAPRRRGSTPSPRAWATPWSAPGWTS